MLVSLGLAWLHGAAARRLARRRSEAAGAAVLRECVARLRVAADPQPAGGGEAQVCMRTGELLAALAALVGADPQDRSGSSLAAAAVRPDAGRVRELTSRAR